MSVHLARFPKPEEVFSEDPKPVLEEWKHLFAVRDAAMLVLEDERQAKRIGKGLEADIEIEVSGDLVKLLQHHKEGLKELLNVSDVRLRVYTDTKNAVHIIVLPATGHKCARCWNFMPEVSNFGIWQNVCTRCQEALTEMKIDPPTEAIQKGRA
jgi:isoleucyl-tRNA synthetase